MECMYCKENDFRRSLMEELCQLPYSTVLTMRDQRHYGRCVVAFRGRHVEEPFQLTEQERNGFFADVTKTAEAVSRLSGAKKINYAIYGDQMPHLHVHVVPKQENGVEWGGPFRMDGEPMLLDDEAWNKLRADLRSLLD